MAITPDGRQVVSASADQTLKVWDLNTAAMLTTFSADARLLCCAVTPDGAAIVAGDTLGNVHFLRVENGELQE